MSRSQARIARLAPRRYRPRLDVLECRELLSTLVVTNPNDDGPGSLRAEVAAAAPGDTITFAPSLVGQTITLTTGPVIDPGKSLTIQGPGADKLTISGGDNSAVLVFYSPDNASFDATVSGLTLADGKSPYSGGALFSNGANLTLKDDVIRDSSSAGAGGGVDAETPNPFNPAGASNTVTIVNTTFLNNTAAVGGAFQSFGLNVAISGSTFRGNSDQGFGSGGILVGNGSVTVSGSTFRENVGGALVHYPGYAPGENLLTVSDSLFVGNTRSSGFGGAIQANGSITTITGTTFLNNATTEASFAQGGAVSIVGGRATIDGSAFIGNRADNPAAQLARGGGLFVEDTQDVKVTNSTFVGNLALGGTAAGGGASRSILFGFFSQAPTTNFSGDTFAGNRAISTASGAEGGGLNLVGLQGATTIAGSQFVGNQSIGGDVTAGQGGNAWAGAVYAAAGFSFSGPPTLTVSGTDFTGNSATGGRGPTGGLAEGGAVYLAGFGTTSFSGGSFVGNSAVSGDSTQAGIPGLFAFGGGLRVLYNGSGAPSITGTQFVHNSVRGGSGGAGADGSSGQGGAISGPVGAITNATFVGNTATGGAGGNATGNGTGGAGGFAAGGAIDGANGPVTNVVFTQNTAAGGNGGSGSGSGAGGKGGNALGGALSASGITVDSSQFVHNSALGGRGGKGGATGAGGAGGDALGGGIFSFPYDGGPGLVVTDSMFVQNEALGGAGGSGVTRGANGLGFGGGIAVLSGTAVIKRTKFVKNRASTDGNDVFGNYTT